MKSISITGNFSPLNGRKFSTWWLDMPFLVKEGLDKDSACELICDCLWSLVKNASAHSQEKCIEAYENSLLYKLIYIRSSRPKIHGFASKLMRTYVIWVILYDITYFSSYLYNLSNLILNLIKLYMNYS